MSHPASRWFSRCLLPSVFPIAGGFAGLLALGLVASPALSQQDFSQVEIQAQHVAGNVHMLTGAGGNIGVSVGEDGKLIVDDQFAPLAGKIRAALRDIDSGELEFVLNTHWHGDHTGSNAEFGKHAHIVAHHNVRERLSKGQTMRGREIPPAPKSALPVLTFDESMSVHWNGEEIEVMHLPTGHTDGDSYVYFKGSKVIHLGDHFFVDRFPFVDLESGGNAVGYAANIRGILSWLPADTHIIPGHGPLADLDDLRRFSTMLDETIGLIREAKEAGKSLDEVREMGLPEKYSSWGSGFINHSVWIQIVYGSLN